MQYISTRGHKDKLNFEEVVIAGLAKDGGLYMPETFPHFSRQKLETMQNLSYQDLALQVMSPFTEGTIPTNELEKIIAKSYSTFRDNEITPIAPLNDNEFILEHFHGPTLAYKDVALQFLGNLLEYILTKKKQNVAIIGATSGDTGSAAIEGCRNCKHIELFMLHPAGKVSDVQRMQMTTILDSNIHNLAIDGNFDDCQNMVKEMFQYPEFMEGKQLVAVNSINWARIMAQIVYYFYATFKLNALDKPLVFSVPTGNFGDILAGYIAKKMGLPIAKLIVATNSNDILDRFFKDNDYRCNGVQATSSPSMDIQISSNFERFLFDLYNYDGDKIAQLMQEFKKSGKLEVSIDILNKAREIFTSSSANNTQVTDIITDIYNKNNYILDPHTATGVFAARQYEEKNPNQTVVTLATAHPAKFPGVVEQAINIRPNLPEHLSDLLQREEKITTLPHNIDAIKKYIVDMTETK